MASNEQIQEYTVRVPNNDDDKSFHVMKFKSSMNIDFSTWSQVRMVRENNQKVFNTFQVDDQPKFGAGSAFGKDAKEEARRKKLGIISRKYNSEAQPWLMKIGGKTGKKYRGVREGGVSDNTTYYVFTHGKDGLVQAYPLSQWYNFTQINRYKTLDADEAEEKFAQRGKILNKWAVMVNKKIKTAGEEDEADPDEGEKKGKGKDKKELKISDMDDWEDDDDDAFNSDSDKEKDDNDDDDEKEKKKGGKDSKKKTKKKKDDDEAFEDSDDGDDEGREVDYMSDESSDSEGELEQEAHIKGVDQDEGLAKMLDSDSSSEDEEKKKKNKEEDEDEDGKKKKKEDGETGKKKRKGGSKNNSRSVSPVEEEEEEDKVDKAEKRKAMVANILDPFAEPASKKSRLEQFGSNAGGSSSVSGNETISEESVRRYLKRRPMTTTDLLKKFRSKRTGIQNAQLVQLLANILKKINPHKQKVKGVTYLSLKEN